MIRNGKISRRTLLKNTSALLALPTIAPAKVLATSAAPGNTITLGLIGLGSMGMRHIDGFLQEEDCRIIAVCDVDAQRRKAAIEKVNKKYNNRDCAQYNDFRQISARKDIDALCISVPDHWHCLCAIEGIRRGKDIYGEKPLALTVNQGKALVRAVSKYNCVWQTGSWQRSTQHFRFGCELVRNGRIGKLRRVDVGIGYGFTPQGSPAVTGIGPQPPMPVPEGFDYPLWLGPAPEAPYTRLRCHWNFRWILDYSGGQVTDWGAHHIDIAHWGMGCDHTGPVEVTGIGLFPKAGLWDAAYDYDFQCTYADGVTMRVASKNHLTQGVRFIGDSGWIHITRSTLKANPAGLLKEKIGPDEIHLPRPAGDHRRGHRRDFLDCIRTRARTIAPVEIGHRSVTPAHLGNIAMILGRKIRWNPHTQQIIDDPTAARMLDRTTRSPWHM